MIPRLLLQVVLGVVVTVLLLQMLFTGQVSVAGLISIPLLILALLLSRK